MIAVRLVHLSLLFSSFSLGVSIDNDVAIRLYSRQPLFHADHSACTESEVALIKLTLTEAKLESMEHSPEVWCSQYCREFAPGTCWVAHRHCELDVDTTQERENEYEGDTSVLSEVEMLMPDINENHLSDFSEKMRSACVEQRSSVLAAIKQLVHEEPLGSQCKKALASRIRVACVRTPGKTAASQS